MKITTTLLIFCIYLLKLAASTTYVLTEYYQITDNECKQNVVSYHYRVSGSCMDGQTISCSLDSNSVTINNYDSGDCSGDYSNSTIDFNTCQVEGKNFVYAGCKADYDMGSNSLVSYYLSNGTCPDSNPDWKSHIIQISYYDLNTCIFTGLGSTKTTDCDSNTFTESLYFSNDQCSTAVWTQKVPFPSCDEFGAPTVMYCNK